MISGPRQVFEFVCQQTGRCCRSSWKVELTHYDYVNLASVARDTALEAAVRDQVVADPHDEDDDDYQRTYHLAKSACGGCSFLDGNRCGMHATLGPLALPEPCRNFPVIATRTAWGTEVGYNLTCPHAITLTAKTPFAIERRDDWERPLDPHQTRASMLPPPEGWKAWRATRQAAIEALNSNDRPNGPTADDLMTGVANAMNAIGGTWTAASVTTWCDALALESRIAESVVEAGPFLGTWGEPLTSPPAWSSMANALALATATNNLELAARYLQQTLHTVYFRTGLPAAQAYRIALAAFGAVMRLAPALVQPYPKGPFKAAIVLVELGLFGELRTLPTVSLPNDPAAPLAAD